jgi:hypothetical protein
MLVSHLPSAILILPAFVSRSPPDNSCMYPSWISRSLCSAGVARCIKPLAQSCNETNSSWVNGGADAIPRVCAGFPSGHLTSSNEGTWVLFHHDSSAAPQTVQTASPVCGTKNFSSMRLYSAPQLHRTIVAILGICPCGTPNQPPMRLAPGSVTASAERKPARDGSTSSGRGEARGRPVRALGLSAKAMSSGLPPSIPSCKTITRCSKSRPRLAQPQRRPQGAPLLQGSR